MSIRIKMLLPMILMAVAAIVAILITVSVIFSGYVDETIAQEVNTAGETLTKETTDMKNQAMLMATELASNSAVANAIAAGDTDALLEISGNHLAGTNMGLCTVTNANAMAVARLHLPQQFDDPVEEEDVQLALQGESNSGFEIDPDTQTLSVCAVKPVYLDDKIIGAVSVGCDLSNPAFVDEMTGLLETEVTVFQDDTRLSTTVTNPDGTRAVGTKASDAVVQQVLNNSEDYSGTAQILERDAFVKYMPLQSNAGENLGMLFAGKYTDVKNGPMMNFIFISLGVSVLLMLIAVPLGLYISHKIVHPIKQLVGAASQIALGDVNVELDINTKEIGRAHV